ncbi:ATP-binding cassette domain-containing protein [Micromonospora sp. CPCC 206061]|uniref:ATP-binding cassette domain-containing protein n=1 Tax=Micromonospora sp. CPCC 206061 TaxID=3122410 RepID=UPI002FF2E30B
MVGLLALHEVVVGVPGSSARVKLSGRVSAGELAAVPAAPEVATAVARTVAGLAAPVSGRLVVGDRDVTGQPPAGRQIGYVPAGGGLLPHLTVRANVEYGLRRRETVRELSRNWAATLTSRLELVPTLNLRPHQLSDGQRLRAAVARAAVCLPEVLVVDLPPGVETAVGLRDLLARASLPTAPAMAVLVCTADDDVPAGADRTVTVVA